MSSFEPPSRDENRHFTALLLTTVQARIVTDSPVKSDTLEDLFIRWNSVQPNPMSKKVETMLLLGEPGTGKTHLARLFWFHRAWTLSEPKKREEIADKLASEIKEHRGPDLVVERYAPKLEETYTWRFAPIPNLVENLFDSLLFGYRKGAFTGATKNRPGALTWWSGENTTPKDVFLDEVTEAAEVTQAKLLGLLSTGEFMPVGENQKPYPLVDRILLASNRDLKELLARQKLRLDLYHRIVSPSITLDPLASYDPRAFENLVRSLLAKVSHGFEGPKITISDSEIDSLQGRQWPGNIRQLEKVLEDFVRSCLVGSTSRRPENVADEVAPLFNLEATGKPSQQTRDLIAKSARAFCRDQFAILRDNPEPRVTPKKLRKQFLETKASPSTIRDAFQEVFLETKKQGELPECLNVSEWSKNR